MNLCLCGAKNGYPHLLDCPYPIYKATLTHKRYLVWHRARRVRRRMLLQKPATDANRTRELAVDKRR